MTRFGEQDILNALTSACTLLSLNLSCLGFYRDHNQIEFTYVLEIAYSLLIFSFHLLDKLRIASHDPYSSQRVLYAMLTSTLFIWLKQTIQYIKFHVLHLQSCDTALLSQFICLVNALQYVLLAPTLLRPTNVTFCRLLSNRYNPTNIPWIRCSPLISPDCLPRNVRATSKKWSDDPPIIERLLKTFTARTLRLLQDVDELEREVLDSSPLQGRQISVSQEEASEVRNESSEEELLRTAQLARSARPSVPRNGMTEEFHRVCEEEDRTKWVRRWKYYKESCRNRHAWGEYFRSELYWDWDLAGSLKRMYKLPRKRAEPSSRPTQRGESQFPAPYASPELVPTRPVANLTNGLLEAVVTESVNKVRIAEVSPTGEITYKTFIVATPPSTSAVGQDSADTRPVVQVHGASDPDSSTSPIILPVPTDSDTNKYRFDDLNHKQETLGVELVTDE